MRYWIYWNDLVQGPFEVGELASLRAFTADLLVCEESQQEWTPAAAVSELLPYFQTIPYTPEVIAPPPPPPPAQPPTLQPLQGEFQVDSLGQPALFDFNGTKNYIFRPAQEPVRPEDTTPPPVTMPFHFAPFHLPGVPEAPPQPLYRPPVLPIPEPDVTPEMEPGIREPEESDRHCEERLAPPLGESSDEAIPRVQSGDRHVAVALPGRHDAPRDDSIIAIPDFGSTRIETPEEEAPKTRLWPWVVGVWALLSLVGLTFYGRAHHKRHVVVEEPPTASRVEAPVVTPPLTQSPEPIVKKPQRPLPREVAKKSIWQAVAGTSTRGTASVAAPAAVAFDNQGQVWVTDQANGRLQRAQIADSVATDGVVQTSAWETFGESGSGPEQLSSPAGVGVDGSGKVWVADQGNNRMQVYDAAARKWTSVGHAGNQTGEFNAPAGVATNRQGQVWVADQGNNRLQVHDPDTQQWTAMGESGNGTGQFNAPSGVAVDTQGRVWVADQGNHRVQVYNPVTKQWRVIGEQGSKVGQFESPASVAVDSKGRVWVTEKGNDRVQVYNPTTKRWTVAGKKGRRTGEFHDPAGAAFDAKGQIWIADRGNHRLQIANALTAAPFKGGTKVKASPTAVAATPVPALPVVTAPTPAPAVVPVPAPAPAPEPVAEKPAPPETPKPAPSPNVTPTPAPVASPAVTPLSSAKDKWHGREQEAIDLVLKKKIYNGKRTVESNAKIMLDGMHEKELLHAAETGERLYLPDKLNWSGLHEEGPHYRVYLNFLAWQANGERSLARSDQFAVDLLKKTVTPLDESTRHDFFDATAIPVFTHDPKAGEIQTVLDGVDLVNKNKLRAMIMKADKQKDEQKKIQDELQKAEQKLQKEIVYFRTKYAEKTLQNIAKAYMFVQILKGK